jgi:hypothetical protein
MVNEALIMASTRRDLVESMIIHSDQGGNIEALDIEISSSLEISFRLSAGVRLVGKQ